MSVDKAAILRQLDDAWATVRAAVESVPEEEVEQLGVVESWSVKDLLGHMAFWADKAASDLNVVAARRPGDVLKPADGEEVDAWNAREAERREGFSFEAVKQEWHKGHEAAREALKAVAPDVLEQNVKGWTMLKRFAEDTYMHYREHAEHILNWQRELETTEA
ncbi:MAG: maleylpyruvate isomerase N-terminal domain-containing protein [Chloroflexi bacterium]|nr:maleylpyruvate isomerase N-terminal domain-containing protein [Chloroflexota bacterium]